jgi:hypothetical protein
MNKSLVYSTRPITGKLVTSLVQQMQFLEMYDNEYTFWDMKKTDSGARHVQSVTGIPMKHTNIHTDSYNKAKNLPNWGEVYESIDASWLADYDSLLLFGGLLSDGSKLKRGQSQIADMLKNKNQLKFVSVGSVMYCVLSIIKAHNEYGIPLMEFCYDTTEAALNLIPRENRNAPDLTNYSLLHGYSIDRYAMQRVDNMQYYYNHIASMFDDYSKKEYDFTFGLTILTKERLHQLQKVEDVADQFTVRNLFVYNKLTGENNFLSRDTYLDLISKSKCTLVMPTYDESTISIYRVIESLHYNCLPLFHSSCKLDEFAASFDIDASDLSDLIVDDQRKFSLTDNQICDRIQFLKDKISEATEFPTL